MRVEKSRFELEKARLKLRKDGKTEEEVGEVYWPAEAKIEWHEKTDKIRVFLPKAEQMRFRQQAVLERASARYKTFLEDLRRRRVYEETYLGGLDVDTWESREEETRAGFAEGERVRMQEDMEPENKRIYDEDAWFDNRGIWDEEGTDYASQDGLDN